VNYFGPKIAVDLRKRQPMTQMFEMKLNATEINVLEAQVLAEIDALPEVISVEEVEARLNDITRALWARWARLSVLVVPIHD
jgi:hypothetical protein